MTTQNRYELVEHTADIGVTVRAESIARLFEDAGYAMCDLITDAGAIRPEAKKKIEVEAQDYEELLVNWLGELLYIFDTRQLLLPHFEIHEIDEKHLKAAARGERLNRDRHELRYDIKAVTYFGLKVLQQDDQWTASVVFDI